MLRLARGSIPRIGIIFFFFSFCILDTLLRRVGSLVVAVKGSYFPPIVGAIGLQVEQHQAANQVLPFAPLPETSMHDAVAFHVGTGIR